MICQDLWDYQIKPRYLNSRENTIKEKYISNMNKILNNTMCLAKNLRIKKYQFRQLIKIYSISNIDLLMLMLSLRLTEDQKKLSYNLKNISYISVGSKEMEEMIFYFEKYDVKYEKLKDFLRRKLKIPEDYHF